MKHNFIVIEGNIGAGKTSLSTLLAKDYNAKLILEEFDENPFLPKFYKNPDKYSFQLELSFLADRFQQLNNILSGDLFKTFLISDYYYTKSLIFAKSTLPEDEFKLYRKIFDLIYNKVPKPDLYVYLYLKPENTKKNIQQRGREYEQEIKLDYLEKIQASYFNYLKQRNDYPILVIDTNGIDFVKNQKDYTKLKEIIFNQTYSNGINRIII